MPGQNQSPEKEYRAGAIWAAVYAKEATTAKAKFTQYSVRIQRRWKDERTGQWGSTTYFRPDDLPKLILVAHKAYEYVTIREVDSGPRTLDNGRGNHHGEQEPTSQPGPDGAAETCP